ncbi:MAG: c-type cytochrome [Bradyrhizobiaceae bacterium]|nr:c-type cytochrome [Bradyrhizobiaceae bacterium]
MIRLPLLARKRHNPFQPHGVSAILHQSKSRRVTLLAALVLAGTVASAASAAVAVDAANGGRLAAQWCATCHVVAPDQRGTTGEAPPFATIARKADFDAAKVALFLLDPHPKMPDMALTRAEAADLAAYIASLRK